MCQKWLDNHVLPVEVGCQGLITDSTSVFLTNLGLSPLDKRKYIKKDSKQGSNCISMDVAIPQSDVNTAKSAGIVSLYSGTLG